MKKTLDEILTAAYFEQASDVHLTAELPPIFRIYGKLKNHEGSPLTAKQIEQYVRAVMDEKLWQVFTSKGEIDFSYEIEGVSRFRVNVFKQRGKIAAAFRLIPAKIPTIDELKLPEILKKIAIKPQGLVLVTGPTGSGKTTTLASMIQYINQVERRHIITLEDPIEYIYEHQQSIIDQREIGKDTEQFSTGLRAALRQDPDVILVGEMRDLDTISTAIQAAETGHLVLATLHTFNAPATIERIVDVFPAEQQTQIRYQLATVLLAVISQRLFPLKTGRGRLAAMEILINNRGVSNLIRNQKLHQIPNIMQTSKEFGMQTMQMHLKELLQKQLIAYESVSAYLEENGYGSVSL